MSDRRFNSLSARRGLLAAGSFFCLLLATSLFPTRGNTQALSEEQFNHTSWATREGAPGDAWAIAQTTDGWLWFGSPMGLYRFDGVQFEHIALEGLDPRLSKAISVLYATENGALWIGYVYGGASLLKDGKFTHFSEAQGMCRGTVVSIADDAKGATWAACAGALERYDGRKWTSIGNEWGYPDKYAHCVFVDQRGTLWVGGEHEVFFLEQGSRRFQPTGIPVRGDGSEFIESPDGRVWYTDDTGIYALPTQVSGSSRTAVSNSRTSFIKLIDRTGSAWLTGGLSQVRRLPFELARKDVGSAGLSYGLSDGLSKTILEDREGNIWITTSTGVDRLRPNNVHRLPDEVAQLGAHALARAGGGGVWIGTTQGVMDSPSDGLWKFDDRLKRMAIPGLTKVTAIDVDTAGKVWIAGPEGVWKEEPGETFRKVAEPPESTRGQQVQALTIDSEGNPWMSVIRSKLFRYRGGAWERNGNLPSLPDRPPLVQTRDRDGRLWFGYRDGKLVVLEAGQLRTFGAAEGLDLGAISAIHVGAHTIVASESQVAVLVNGVFHVVTVPGDSPVLEGISGILESENGDLWLNGFQGLVHVTASDFDRAVRDSSYALPFELFDAEDGYPGMAQRLRPIRSIIEGSAGRIWFVGTLNVATLDPSSIRRNTVPPPVAIRGLTAAGHQYSALDGLSLAAGTRDLQIDYTALSLSRPDRTHFRYRLEGFDGAWVPAGARRQAFYTNLDPGRYRFRVAAANENGVWNESGAAIAIVIPPTFVQTRGFVVLCVATAGLLLWFLYAQRVRRLTENLRNRLEERVAERERIARELHDTLLQGVQGLILKFQAVNEEIPPDTPARQMMEAALDRADDVMVEGRDRVKDLRIPPASGPDLPTAVGAIGSEQAKEQSTRFNLSVEGNPRPLNPIVREEVLRIAHEALANAFRHARATKIETEIIYHKAELRLRFRDDGCGISEVILATGRPEHWGLPGMRERARKIRANFEVWSRAGAGTEIELRVPARIAYLKNGSRWSWRLRGAVRAEQ